MAEPRAGLASLRTGMPPPVADRRPRPGRPGHDGPLPPPPARRRSGRGSAPPAWPGCTFTSTSSGATSIRRKHRGPVAGMDGGAVPRFRRADQERILERPAIDEKLGSPAGGLRFAGPLDEARRPGRHRRRRPPEPASRPAPGPRRLPAARSGLLPGRNGQPAACRRRAARIRPPDGPGPASQPPRARRGSRSPPNAGISGGPEY